MSGWQANPPHRCKVPRSQDILNAKVNDGALWVCPDCSVAWKLEIVNQIGTLVNQTTGLRRAVGYLP